MFKLDYRIINNEYDDFWGENGFFQLTCNGFLYGEMYPSELNDIMDQEALFDWFERLIRVIENLNKKNYIVLSDVETYNTWLEFKREGEDLVISIVKAQKVIGSQDIEYHLENIQPGEWINQKVKFREFKEEILRKSKEYIEKVIYKNSECKYFSELRERIDDLETV